MTANAGDRPSHVAPAHFLEDRCDDDIAASASGALGSEQAAATVAPGGHHGRISVSMWVSVRPMNVTLNEEIMRGVSEICRGSWHHAS